MKIIIPATVAFVVLAGVAFAGPARPTVTPPWMLMSAEAMATDLFARFDHDADGAISRNEAKAYFDEVTAAAAKAGTAD